MCTPPPRKPGAAPPHAAAKRDFLSKSFRCVKSSFRGEDRLFAPASTRGNVHTIEPDGMLAMARAAIEETELLVVLNTGGREMFEFPPSAGRLGWERGPRASARGGWRRKDPLPPGYIYAMQSALPAC